MIVCSHRVNCSFYFKIGACRHGDRCSRIHNKPTFSQVFHYTTYTVTKGNHKLSSLRRPFAYRISTSIHRMQPKLLMALQVILISIVFYPLAAFINPCIFVVVPGLITMSDEEAQEHFDNFFEDVFVECEDKVHISNSRLFLSST